jgi:uncharacterized membrane protein YesL
MGIHYHMNMCILYFDLRIIPNMYTYIHIQMYIYIHIRIYIYTYIYMYINIFMPVRVSVYPIVEICSSVYKLCIQIKTNVHICVYMYAFR